MPATPGEASASSSEPDRVDIDLSKVPAIAEVEKHLARSDVAGALRVAFPLIMIDVQRVYDLVFPAHWTARDVLAHGLRPDMGRLPDLLFQLYSLYEPVRFGERRDWMDGDVRGIVRRIYTETGLRSLVGLPTEPTRRPITPSTFSVIPSSPQTPGSTPGGKPW